MLMLNFQFLCPTGLLLTVICCARSAAATAALPPAYAVTDLTLGGTVSDGLGINAKGQVTGQSYTTGNAEQHAFLWTPSTPNGANGTMQDLGTLGGTESRGYGINASGRITGYAWITGAANFHTFLYDGAMHDLGTLSGDFSTGRAVNDYGHVVGDSARHAYLYDGAMHDLGTLGGTESYAYAINADGQVTGSSFVSGDGQEHAYLWTPVNLNGAAGSMIDLGTLGGRTSIGYGINASGLVTGVSLLNDDYTARAFLYDGAMHDLGTLGIGGSSYAFGINNSGQVVGRSGGAFLWTSGDGMVNLNTLIDPQSGWELIYANAINDAGQIVGTGYIGGEQHAFLLTPVPEPASLALLALGAPILFGWRSRQLRARVYRELHRAKCSTLFIAASLAAVPAIYLPMPRAHADIFQWEYINPANPALGKKQSTTLCPDGADAIAATGANLYYRNLTKAYLIGANLSDATAGVTNFSNADLSHANFSNVSFTGSTVDDWYVGSNLNGANLTQANLSRAFLGSSTMINADLRYVNLSNALLAGTYVISGGEEGNWDYIAGTNLTGANLSGANLTNSDFSAQCYMFTCAPGANFSSANLSGADARGANTLYAIFSATNTNNMIQSNGHIASLDLASGVSLIVRDYDGNPTASPPSGPLPIFVEQHLAMSGAGTLRFKFDADTWDSTISFAPGISVARGGMLELTFDSNVNLAGQIGRMFDLFDWTGVTPTGTFDVSSPYTWNLSNLYTTGEVTLTAVSEVVAGDYNQNGTVDAADYTVWRDNLGGGTLINRGVGITGPVGAADYNIWKANFGQSLGGGSGSALLSAASLSSAVPEPVAVLLAIAAFGLCPARFPRRVNKEYRWSRRSIRSVVAASESC
jgi:probable HAF family extracellular repeat protein